VPRVHFDWCDSGTRRSIAQHRTSNPDIAVEGDSARAIVACTTIRSSGEHQMLNTNCVYFFGMAHEAKGWKIAAIKQKVLLNDGDTGIHAGIVRK